MTHSKEAYMPTLVAGVAFINENKQVLTIPNRHGSHVFIGGKIETSETPLHALIRECGEELPLAHIKGLWFYRSFSGKNRRGEDIEVYIFTGEVEGDLTPGGELTDHETKWLGFEEYQGSPIMTEIMAALKTDGFIR